MLDKGIYSLEKAKKTSIFSQRIITWPFFIKDAPTFHFDHLFLETFLEWLIV